MATVAPLEIPISHFDNPLLTVNLPPAWVLNDDTFFTFCQLNPDLRLERTATGELIIMPPTGGNTSHRNAEITTQLHIWSKQDGSGKAFDSSGGFVLPNGAVRSPDASWVDKNRLAVLTPEQRKQFLPLCPDFVIELRSETDRLSYLKHKMEEYRDNGAQLGWLIDPINRRIYVYRPHEAVQELDNPETLSAAPVISFVLDLRDVW